MNVRPDPSLPPVGSLLRVAREAARAGGERTLEFFGGRLDPERKPDGSPVTEADRAAEREIRRVISATFPDHTILGEEAGSTGRDPRVRWIVDPIDGTKSFVHGVPLYSVLVAVEVDARPVVGVIGLPALQESIEAAIGLGCRWNGKVAHVSPTRDLADATVLMTSARAVESAGVPLRRLAAASRLQRSWGDAYGYALVATGRADVMIDTGLKVWDVAPLGPILEEAGGRLTGWDGTPGPREGNVLASNGRLHDAALRVLTAP